MRKRETKTSHTEAKSKRTSDKNGKQKPRFDEKAVARIQHFFESNPGGNYNYRQVSAAVGAVNKEQREFLLSWVNVVDYQ